VTLAGDDQGWLRETIASDFEALWARVGLGVSF